MVRWQPDPDWVCVCVERSWTIRKCINCTVTSECLTKFRQMGGRRKSAEDGLHPLSCLHGYMCCFTDSPLAHPNNTSPPTSEPIFSSQRGYSQCLSVMWSLLLHPDGLLPPPCCFPAHMTPPGSGQWPRRQYLNTKSACFPPCPPPCAKQDMSHSILKLLNDKTISQKE